MVRKSKGRQKINMVKMQNESNLLVTFSKRRSGLFKKASEICTLCGAEIAIVVFSPGGKVYSFGHPCVENVISRFFTRNAPPRPPPANENGCGGDGSGTQLLVEAHRNASVRELNMQLTQVQNLLEAERIKGETLDQMRKSSQVNNWWESPVNELSIQQLEQLKGSMEDLRKNVNKQVHWFMPEAAATTFPFHAATDSFGRGLVPLPYEHAPSNIGPVSGSIVPFDARGTGPSGPVVSFETRAARIYGETKVPSRAVGLGTGAASFDPSRTTGTANSMMFSGFNICGPGFFLK